MLYRLTLFAAVALPLGAGAAWAQTQADATQMARLASANQLGVIEYCQSHGWTDQAAVDAQKTSTAALPPATDTSGLAAAEATGKQGTFVNNGNQTTLAQLANGKNTSVQDLCGQLGGAVKAVAARMASMPGGVPSMPSGMPAMPNGMPAMPAMPGGMPAMPSGMPGMPSGMPGMPSTTGVSK